MPCAVRSRWPCEGGGTMTRAAVAIVGMGPRGTIVLERLAARLKRALATDPASVPRLRVHLVEPTQFGAGAVWRTDQPADMCMNTLAAASTLFTDDSWTGPAPAPGPTFHQWAESVRRARRTDDGVSLEAHAAELDAMLAWAHPSRALFGQYAAWAFRRARAALAATGRVELVEHRTRLEALARTDPGFRLSLADGTELQVDAAVLALGWVATAPGAGDRQLAEEVQRAGQAADLRWVAPDSPIDQDLDGIAAGEHVLVRGLGMGFFDFMSRVTIGRGGRFEATDDHSATAGLVYHPSGDEPVLHVGSDRGVPFLSKTRYGSLPPRPALTTLRAAVAAAPRPLPVAELFPAILRDAITDHARVLARTTAERLTGPEELVARLEALPLDAGLDEVRGVVADHVPEALRFEPTDWEFPAAHAHHQSAQDFDRFVHELLRRDLAEADRGHDSAIKAGLWAISAARMVVGLASTFHDVDAEGDHALRRLLRWGGLLGSGPPAFRNEQLLALAEAGLVHFVGPRSIVQVQDDRFAMWSPVVPGSRVTSGVLVDAWMRSPDVLRPADPLAAALLEQGLVRPLRRPDAQGSPVSSGAVDVVPRTGETIGADGRPVDGLFMVGIPVDGARRDTIQAPVPGIDSSTLHEASAVAGRLLELLGQAAGDAADRRAS